MNCNSCRRCWIASRTPVLNLRGRKRESPIARFEKKTIADGLRSARASKVAPVSTHRRAGHDADCYQPAGTPVIRVKARWRARADVEAEFLAREFADIVGQVSRRRVQVAPGVLGRCPTVGLVR